MGRPPELDQLLFLLDTAYDRKSWHGTNLRGSIRGVSLEQAVWRPAPGRHNIWELVVHAAYWKYAALRRITAAARGSFARTGSNWFTRPEDETALAWRSDTALLETTHRQLRDAVAHLPPNALSARTGPSKLSHAALLTGVAAHDLYHAGQIQLLKKLFRS